MGKNISSFLLGAVASVSMAQTASADSMLWNGLYAGVHAEYLWGDADLGLTFVAPVPDGEADGWAGGVTGGYNHVSGAFLFGVEADIALADVEGTAPYLETGFLEGLTVDLDWLSTIRGRVGFAQENFLIFATGGLALGGLQADYYGVSSSQALDATASGYTLGGGVEMMLSDQLSAKAEYLFVDLGREDLDLSVAGFSSVDFEASLVKFGLNWHFQP